MHDMLVYWHHLLQIISKYHTEFLASYFTLSTMKEAFVASGPEVSIINSSIPKPRSKQAVIRVLFFDLYPNTRRCQVSSHIPTPSPFFTYTKGHYL
jgi:hypothetical protein